MQEESQHNDVDMGSEKILPTIGLIRFDTAPSERFVSYFHKYLAKPNRL